MIMVRYSQLFNDGAIRYETQCQFCLAMGRYRLSRDVGHIQGDLYARPCAYCGKTTQQYEEEQAKLRKPQLMGEDTHGPEND